MRGRQLSLDDLPAARTTDPPTSHAAARSLDPRRVGRQVQDVVLVVANSPSGAICAEIAERLGRDRGCVARRCTDAVRHGYLRVDGTRPGPSGREQMNFRATALGQTIAARAAADEAQP